MTVKNLHACVHEQDDCNCGSVIDEKSRKLRIALKTIVDHNLMADYNKRLKTDA